MPDVACCVSVSKRWCVLVRCREVSCVCAYPAYPCPPPPAGRAWMGGWAGNGWVGVGSGCVCAGALPQNRAVRGQGSPPAEGGSTGLGSRVRRAVAGPEWWPGLSGDERTGRAHRTYGRRQHGPWHACGVRWPGLSGGQQVKVTD
jgi:hypothetical protein